MALPVPDDFYPTPSAPAPSPKLPMPSEGDAGATPATRYQPTPTLGGGGGGGTSGGTSGGGGSGGGTTYPKLACLPGPCEPGEVEEKFVTVGYGTAGPGETIYAVKKDSGDIFTTEVGTRLPATALGSGYSVFATEQEALKYSEEHKPVSTVKELASEYNLDYRSALAEVKSVADYVERAVIGGKCGPWGITEDQVNLVIDYYRDIGQESRADKLVEHYALVGHPEGFVKRAEVVGYDVFGELADYKEGGGYRLDLALAAGVVTGPQLLQWFPESEVKKAVDAAEASKGGSQRDLSWLLEAAKDQKGFMPGAMPLGATKSTIPFPVYIPTDAEVRQHLYMNLALALGPVAIGAGAAALPAVLPWMGKAAWGAAKGAALTTLVSGGAAVGYGLKHPQTESWEVAQKRLYQEYLGSPELAAQITKGKAEGKDLRSLTFEEFSRGAFGRNVPLEYQGGLAGAYGIGAKAQADFFSNLRGERPWYSPRSLISGMGTYLAPHALVQQAYPIAGAKAFTTLIPHFGPTAVYPFVMGASPGQKALGIGMAALPYAMGPLGMGASAVGRALSRTSAGPVLRGLMWAPTQLYKGASAVMRPISPHMPWQAAYDVSYLAGKAGLARMPGVSTFGVKAGWWPEKIVPVKYWPSGRSMTPAEIKASKDAWFREQLKQGKSTVETSEGVYFYNAKTDSWSLTPTSQLPKEYFTPPSGTGGGPTMELRAGYVAPQAPVTGFPQLVMRAMPAAALAVTPWAMALSPTMITAATAAPAQAALQSAYQLLQRGQITPIQYSTLVKTLNPTLTESAIVQQQTLDKVMQQELTELQQVQLRQIVVNQQVTQPAKKVSLLQQQKEVDLLRQVQTPVSMPSMLPYTIPYTIPSPIPGGLPEGPRPPSGDGGNVFLPWIPGGFMGGLGGGARGSRGRGGLLGVGKWAFGRFPVSAPHPLLQKVVGYEYMKGAEKAYGVKQPKVKTGKPTGGLVRMGV